MPIDYREYPADWRKIRARILYRAGERRNAINEIVQEARCEECKAENHRPHPRTGSYVVLTVAHLDHDKENHAVTDDRLLAMCQACHLGYDGDHHRRVRRMHRHAYGNAQQLTIEETQPL